MIAAMAFEKLRIEFLITYKLNSELTADVAEKLVADVKQELATDPKFEAIVFDLQSHDLNYKAFRVLSPLSLELRKLNKQIYALSETRSVHALIKSEGMDKIIQPISALAEVRTGAPVLKTAPKLDVNFINPFIEGTIHTLSVQCQAPITPGKPLLKGKEEFKCQTDIAGLIGITSQSFTGSLAICFPEKVFLGLMSKMLGEQYTEITDELKDGAAELLNIIFGHAKRVLNANGYTIEKALPTVIRAVNLKIDHSGSHDSIIVPFHTEDSVFFMEIGIEKF